MKTWRLIAGVTLVLALGVLVGSLGTQLYHRHRIERHRKDPAARRAIILNRLAEELGLTERQQQEFKVIIEEVDEKRRALFKKRRAEIKELFDESFIRMKQKLDPDQQQKLEELRTRLEKRKKARKDIRPPR
jgi:hypothetical protein